MTYNVFGGTLNLAQSISSHRALFIQLCLVLLPVFVQLELKAVIYIFCVCVFCVYFVCTAYVLYYCNTVEWIC